MLRRSHSRFGLAVRILPVVGLLTALVSVAPAIAATAASAGPLAVSQSTTGPATIGLPLTYTITVTNTSTGVASSVFLGDTLPSGASLVGPLPSPDLCVKGHGGFACLAGDLAAGQSFSINFSIVPTTSSVLNRAVTTGFANGSFVTNAVGMTLAVAPAPAPAPAPIPAPAPASTDVQVVGHSTTGAPLAGAPFAYIFEVKNGGSQAATGVTFSDTLPTAETSLLALSTRGTCTQANGTISCSLGDLGVGATALVAIGATAPSSAGTYVDTATVSSATPDSNLANNSTSVTILIK